MSSNRKSSKGPEARRAEGAGTFGRTQGPALGTGRPHCACRRSRCPQDVSAPARPPASGARPEVTRGVLQLRSSRTTRGLREECGFGKPSSPGALRQSLPCNTRPLRAGERVGGDPLGLRVAEEAAGPSWWSHAPDPAGPGSSRARPSRKPGREGLTARPLRGPRGKRRRLGGAGWAGPDGRGRPGSAYPGARS